MSTGWDVSLKPRSPWCMLHLSMLFSFARSLVYEEKSENLKFHVLICWTIFQFDIELMVFRHAGYICVREKIYIANFFAKINIPSLLRISYPPPNSEGALFQKKKADRSWHFEGNCKIKQSAPDRDGWCLPSFVQDFLPLLIWNWKDANNLKHDETLTSSHSQSEHTQRHQSYLFISFLLCLLSLS